MTKILTQVATHANTIADTFRAAFARTKLGEYAIEMTAPEDSTKGGLLARQHVRLRPESGMALVVGAVNAFDRNAEVHDYAVVSAMHAARFRRPPPFTEAEYAAFTARTESVLGAFGIHLDVKSEAVSPPRPRAPTTEGEFAPPAVAPSRVPLVLAVGLAVMTAAAIAWLGLG